MIERPLAISILRIVLLAAVSALGAPAGAVTYTNVYFENFQGYNPASDASGTGSAFLGGQGQLEDIAGSPWSGTSTDASPLQTRVIDGADRNLRLRTDQINPIGSHRLITSAIFSPVTQSDAFRLSYNLDSYTASNTGSGRFQVGVRDSSTDKNVFGIELQSVDATQLRMHGHQWSGVSNEWLQNTQIATMPANLVAANVRSVEMLYDPLTSNMTINAYDGADLTGTLLGTVTAAVTIGPFSFDSVFLQATQGNTSLTRISDVGIDDIALAVEQQQIPEPASAAVWTLAGVVAAGAFCWKRRRHRARS